MTGYLILAVFTAALVYHWVFDRPTPPRLVPGRWQRGHYYRGA